MISIDNVSQLAYITADIDRAVALFREKYQIPEFLILREIMLSEEMGVLDVAMAYAGDTMIELITPHAGASPIYRGGELDFDREAHQLHHIGVFLPDREKFEQVRADALEMGLSIPVSAEHETLDFFYVDARAHLGHYIEYVLLHDAGKALFASLPGAKP